MLCNKHIAEWLNLLNEITINIYIYKSSVSCVGLMKSSFLIDFQIVPKLTSPYGIQHSPSPPLFCFFCLCECEKCGWIVCWLRVCMCVYAQDYWLSVSLWSDSGRQKGFLSGSHNASAHTHSLIFHPTSTLAKLLPHT